MDFKPKLAAFDLDGTLAASKERMSADMGERLAKLVQKMPVAVMSGAGFPQFEKQFLPALPSDTALERLYIFADNAAQCWQYRHAAWQTVYDHAFTPEEKEHIMGVLTDALAEVGLSNTPVRVWGERIEDRGAEIAFSPLGQQAPLDEKEAWHKDHNDVRKRLHEVLEQKLPDFANAMGGLTTIDITRKGITKAFGIRELVKLTGISVSEMLYIGDALEEGGNDYVVVETGVKTREVFGPDETAKLIEEILPHKTL
ncbi:MAG TPA: HAD-IIB family hydrolase [Candidatus Paceibacterota bacterium]